MSKKTVDAGKPEPIPRDRALSTKQRAFAEAYLKNGRNGAAAYREIYKATVTPQRATEAACEMLKHPKISLIIKGAEGKAEMATAKVVADYAVTRASLAAHTARMAHADIRGAFEMVDGRVTMKPFEDMPGDVVAALTGVEIKPDGTIKLSFVDKRQATVDLARLNGWITEKRETRTITSLQDLSDDELNAVEASITQGRGRR